MGTYSYEEHLELFGGPPEPGDYAPTLDEADALRGQEQDEPRPQVPYPFCIHPAKCAGLTSCPRRLACSE